MNVVVLGDANADLSAPVRAFPAEGDDCPLLDLGWGSGGAGVNVATALALLGAEVHLLARVGTDPAAEVALRAARGAGVDLGAIQRDPALATGLCFAVVSPGGERTFFSHRGANHALATPELGALFEGAGHLHVCGHALLEGGQRDTALTLIAEASRRAISVSLDLCLPLLRAHPEAAIELAPTLAILFGNEPELSLVAASHAPAGAAPGPEAALDLLEHSGARCIALKRGARGSTIAEGGCREEIPAFAIAAVDSTGAGDAHVGATLFAILRGASPPLAARLGNAMGALTTTRRGAAEALPTRAELSAFLDARGAPAALKALLEPR
ncbi:MAG: carbohydrate kinase family protein [Byssovorax sp.]